MIGSAIVAIGVLLLVVTLLARALWEDEILPRIDEILWRRDIRRREAEYRADWLIVELEGAFALPDAAEPEMHW